MPRSARKKHAPDPPDPPDPLIRLNRLMRPGLIADDWVILANCMQHKTGWIHHRFNVYAIGVVTSGRGSYQAGNGPVQRIEPGSLFHVYPGPIFHYGPDPGTEWCEYHFGLDGPRFQHLREAGVFATDGIVQQLTNVTALVVQFRELIDVVRRAKRGDADRAVLMAERLLLELYYNRVGLQPTQTLSKPIEAILRHCQEHLSAPIDFEVLAATHAMSYSSLRQAVRNVTGLAPAHYLTALRCDTARMLLAESELSIKAIGAKIGIDDPYTFSRIFKRTVGVSPRDYRSKTRLGSGRWR